MERKRGTGSKRKAMPSLNYIAELAPLVESGKKRCTIRAQRKHPIYIGDRLYHFTGLRTKSARRLLESTCMIAVNVRMRWRMKRGEWRRLHVELNGRVLKHQEITELAIRDGFETLRGLHPSAYDAFAAWFLPAGREEFIGQYIEW